MVTELCLGKVLVKMFMLAYDSLITLMYLDFVLVVHNAPEFPANEDMGHK